MPRKRKNVIKRDEAYPETPTELPLSHWVGSLLRVEQTERDLIAREAGAQELDGAVSSLVYALQSMRKLSLDALRKDAAMALPEVKRFLTHPGRHVEPAHTIYWDWTMDASCAEEVPAVEVTVAGEARLTAKMLRRCLQTGLSGGKP